MNSTSILFTVYIGSAGQVHTEQSEETRVWLRQRLGAEAGAGGLVAGRWQNVHTHRSQSRPGLVQTLPGGATAYIPLSPSAASASAASPSLLAAPAALSNASSHAL